MKADHDYTNTAEDGRRKEGDTRGQTDGNFS